MKNSIVKNGKSSKLSLDAFKKQQVSNLNVDSHSQVGGITPTITTTIYIVDYVVDKLSEKENDCH